ncbi:hypothetical protein [Sphingomicrobium sediminis]|uniref:Uncharacterized protein n=1 Tax=Sphingomicrobium sediminis TaxID=2950949 RepID=A0A9X2J191_9SPHN|nr:hypothetical protein [Sphingomicrobium sediminis]MCM8556479.1 hypothetical protein [Sphingomicrobium sediminis]
MDQPFIADRTVLDDATALIDIFGDRAGEEAAMRAAVSRQKGNVIRFCHWRQIERIVLALGSPDSQGTVH